jgi:hypothetical protein
MKATEFLNEEIELIIEALNHLHFETDRNTQYQHVNHLPKLKKHFLDKKKKIKTILKKINKYENKLQRSKNDEQNG